MEPWRVRLAEGDADEAWGLFIDRYRPLIMGTIRRTIEDETSALDVLADVCGTLSANELERLRRYHDSAVPRARFSTWLVTVVHHLVVDWLRKRDGRKRVRPPASLSGVQQLIFREVFVEQHSHAEAYERVRALAHEEMSFGKFLKELAETYRVVERTRAKGALHYMVGAPQLIDVPEGSADDIVSASSARDRLTEVMESLPPDERLAVQLSVVDELPADAVARTVGWPNAKAVYNRVYRALTKVRNLCEQQGIRLADF